MSLLAALVRACDRMPDAPPFGYSSEKIGFCVTLNPDGAVSEVIDLRATDKKRSPRRLMVPQGKKRTVGIDPNVLWDKTSYVLGVTALEEEKGEAPDEDEKKKRERRIRRLAEEHGQFVSRHLSWLEGSEDEGLLALARFLTAWRPEDFILPLWSDELRDQNLVFRLAGETGFLHDRPAARDMSRRLGAEGASDPQICLVTGNAAPVARLHPSIKGVWNAQSSGASLISFNADAYESYGHVQGDNAPISEAAAFAYTTALNRFLSDKDHRLQIGDASTVFWADASDAGVVREAEGIWAGMFDGAAAAEADEAIATSRIAHRLTAIRNGQKLARIAPELASGVRFHVLGLAPNAARLSVRFWWESDFGTLTENYQRYLSDTAIEPLPREGWPPLWRYLSELAPPGKEKRVPPLLAGEWMRAILTGTSYPMTLLSTTLMRLRADADVNALRAAILRSVLVRNLKKEVPVALDPANDNKGYILGRLFAVYEAVQYAALGGNVNATIKDKFYGSASATPQKVFRTLDAGAQNHFSRLRKASAGRAVNLEKLLISVTDLMDPAKDPIPASLNPAEQALFGIGYYHQRSEFFRKREDRPDEETEITE